MSYPDPRISAYNAVCQCLTRRGDLQAVLDQELQNISQDRDRALTTEIVYGYLRFRGRIDYAMSLFLDRPHDLPSKLKILLGLAGYEIFFLDRVPDYAAVSRTVDLSAGIFGRKMSGLVNAVLRKALHVDIHSEQTFKKDSPGDILFWSRYYSCPEWIIKMWKKAYGKELCLEYLRQTLDKPPLGLREAPGFCGVLGNSHNIARRIAGSVLLKKRPPELDQHLLEGRVFRQSFAGQQAMHELGMKDWNQPVWDMCAGSGGKTFLMLDQGKQVYSSDVNLKRLGHLKKTGSIYGGGVCLFAASGDAPPLKTAPGTILIDAPCTGLGVLSRRPDIKWKRRLGDIERLTRTQTGLMNSAAGALAASGRIVYLTCTLNRHENERIINDFLYTHKDFVLEKMFQTDADQDLKEFFFGAVLKKL
ncbi:MAG: RsmB/NOP family class I SAM-dependent RNA methyltransferase [Desulfonatronovibrio sp.]